MATIDYKEKYEQALKRASKLHDNINASSSRKAWLEDIFPELKESEGERTWVINYLSNRKLNSSTIAEKENLKKAIAWLEKHKYTEDDLDKAYKCADEVQYRRGYEDAKKEIEKQGDKSDIGISSKTKQKLKGNLNKALQKETGESWNEFLDEQKPAEDVDLPEFESHLCLMFQKFRTKGICTNGEIIDYVKEHSQKLRDILVNPAWSEEDEKYNNIVVSALYNPSIEGLYNFHKINRSDVITWLKSLRPQSQWKPSDEQMKVLQWCLPLWAKPKSKAILKSLINDLKKLREE